MLPQILRSMLLFYFIKFFSVAYKSQLLRKLSTKGEKCNAVTCGFPSSPTWQCSYLPKARKESATYSLLSSQALETTKGFCQDQFVNGMKQERINAMDKKHKNGTKWLLGNKVTKQIQAKLEKSIYLAAKWILNGPSTGHRLYSQFTTLWFIHCYGNLDVDPDV